MLVLLLAVSGAAMARASGERVVWERAEPASPGRAPVDSIAADSVLADPAPPEPIPASRLLPLPFVFYQPETKWGGGAGLLHTYHTGRQTRVSSNSLFLVFTQRSQFSATLAPECYTPEDRWRLAGMASWSRFPDLFYGLGNSTEKRDEEDYTLEHARLFLDVRRALRPWLLAGGIFDYRRTWARKLERGGSLMGRHIAGSDGGELVGAGLVLALDDRDSPILPSRGSAVTLSCGRYAESIGSDFESTRLELDARRYLSVTESHVIAAQVILGGSSGAPPFYDLASLGGSTTLRGIYEGRFRDRNRVVGQMEYRFPLKGRLGGTLFAGAGEVARDPSGFRLDSPHAAGGAGLRFLLSREEGVRLRIDYGIAEGQTGMYLALGEAF